MSKRKARIIKADNKNWQVQVYDSVTNKKGETEWRWSDTGGWYSNLNHAIESALRVGFEDGSVVTSETLSKVATMIAVETKSAYGGA